jgi:formamidopyrimidine-DNA glycosylase
MPELPELVHVEAQLRKALVGRTITGARTGDPLVLRLMTTAPFPAVLVGRTLGEVTRRGHFMRFSLGDDLHLLVNAMLAGKFQLRPVPADEAEASKRLPASVALALTFDNGVELRYADDKRMGKVYVAPGDKLAEIPVYGTLGVEVLSPDLTLDRFRKLIAKRRDQVRQFLMDKAALASIGNAYADEILFAARLHPKTFCHKLTADQVAGLHAAIHEVLPAAIAEVARRNEPIDVKVRDFLKVRGRAGKPCPVCGTTIREVRVGDGDACFCPQCQPTDRKLFVDFSKLPPKSK